MSLGRVLAPLALVVAIAGPAGAATAPAGPDAVYFHGKVVTLDPASHIEEA